MALFKDPRFLSRSTHALFDAVHPAGGPAEHPGIYRCEGCGYEVTAGPGQTLPPADHHSHTAVQGPVRWRIVVYAIPY